MKYVRLRVWFITATVIAISACSIRSPDANFYLLENDMKELEATSDLRIGLGPVTVADYLQRPQIAVRTRTSQIIFSEFERWASDLRGQVMTALEHDLSHQMKTDNIFEYPWRKSDNVDYAITVTINRFDVSFEESMAYLEARVVITVSDGSSESHSFQLTEALQGDTYASAVATQRQLLSSLSSNIAQHLK